MNAKAKALAGPMGALKAPEADAASASVAGSAPLFDGEVIEDETET